MTGSLPQSTLAFRECAQEIIRLLGAHRDWDAFASAAAQPISTLLGHSDLRTAGVPRETIVADSGRFLYYDGDLSIVTAQLHEGLIVPPHNHNSFELIAVYNGEIDHVRYGGTIADTNELPVVERRTMTRGDLVVIPPGEHRHGWTALSHDTWVVVASGVTVPEGWFGASDQVLARTADVARSWGIPVPPRDR